MPAPDPAGRFASDTHRRVAGNLAQPRSAADLARILGALDPHVDDSAYRVDGAQSFVDDLKADGLVKTFGPYEEAAAKLVTDIRDDPDVPTLPEEKADALVARMGNPAVFPYPEAEEQHVLTERGLELLQAPPAEGEKPPLTGEALRAAEELNARIAAEGEELAISERRRNAELLRKRAEELDAEADELEGEK
ncbi:MAG: hypothetical protein LC798_12740 [Chloroflexi bacterium]|nr:hypothetical protein [Chloroflexota bacterium]